jgi:hypothetical protein
MSSSLKRKLCDNLQAENEGSRIYFYPNVLLLLKDSSELIILRNYRQRRSSENRVEVSLLLGIFVSLNEIFSLY